MKTLKVEDDVWKKLMDIKIKNGYRNMSQVIRSLMGE